MLLSYRFHLAVRFVAEVRQQRPNRVRQGLVAQVCVVAACYPGVGVSEQLGDGQQIGAGLASNDAYVWRKS